MAYDDAFRFDGVAVVKKSSAHTYGPTPIVSERKIPRRPPARRGAMAGLQTSRRGIQLRRRRRDQINPVFWSDGDRYHANVPIMVLAVRGDHQAAITIPQDYVFEVVGPATDERFVTVRVREEEFLVFASDLRDRGTPLKEMRSLTGSATA